MDLPIAAVLSELKAILRQHRDLVLQAPPGAGKSTVVPLVLLDEPWAAGRKILLLEPRRLAARAVAGRLAQSLGEAVGGTVGYRMRLDTRVSRATRIEVVTEGILTRMLQSDPALEGVAAVIFDEFHERSLQADLGLALALDARDNVAPDLKIIVMSATLDGAAVAKLLGDAPILTAEGRTYPVETRFVGKGLPLLPGGPWTPGVQESPERTAAQLISRALREESGDVLAFLPGAGEIRRVQSLLEGQGFDRSVRVAPLFGELSGADQDAALAPSPAGRRKVVLATNIAETSLTIEGVRVVVDSGLVRRSVFDPATGMGRLETQRISRASAEQRQGRAGRLAPGVCYRAWSEGAHRSLAPFTPPEIADADLAPLALELAGWGARDAASLRWLDPPPAAMLASARDLLVRLGALDDQGRIAAHGREMSRLGVHPRLAHLLLEARRLDLLPLGAALAALLSERDLLRAGKGSRDADVRTRLEVLRGESTPADIDRGSLQRARRAMNDFLRQLGGAAAGDGRPHDARSGELLALAYPDRVGRRRASGQGRYFLSNGRGAGFTEAQSIAQEEFIVAVELDDREREARILLAAPLGRLEAEKYLPDAPAKPAAKAAEEIEETQEQREYRARLEFLQALGLQAGRRLEELAPSHLQLPNGLRARIDYLDEHAPSVSVRLQDALGLMETPRLAGGRVPVTFKLLSPARRPLQITRDLAGFWRGSYAEVRKDMRGRYPKHEWPENPLEAKPTRGVRRRS